MVSIRVAGVDDADVLADLGRRTFHETFADQNKPEDMDAYMREAFDVERLASEMREPGAAYLLAETPTRVIGFAKVAPADPPACVTGPSPMRLVRLYVSADAIGSGVGAALMRACIERAKASGRGCFWLGVWEHNHRARAFYERWGFATVGTEAFRLGNEEQTDLLMQLVFDEADEP